MGENLILFDEGPLGAEGGGGTVFRDPVDVIRAWHPDEVGPALDLMSAAQDRGHWLAGMASYELGYLYSAKLRPLLPPAREVPLLEFGVFRRPEAGEGFLRRARSQASQARLGQLSADWDRAAYDAAFERIKELIAAGDIYQANLTFGASAAFAGPALGLYGALVDRQPVRHGAFMDLTGTDSPAATRPGPAILSRSPELFFRVSADGTIETRPMKGTAPRGLSDADDQAAREWLRRDPKNRAENLMIVDLLRNDLSRVARVGSVEVPELFAVESYATVHQMTSLVRARLREGVRLPEIFAAIFPCGSVTGAPKIRAMQVLRELEAGPRGVYCGALGWVSPQGTMCFNVAIRTMVLGDEGRLRLNVGGGIVHDSTAASEYEEALWKARFAAPLPG